MSGVIFIEDHLKILKRLRKQTKLIYGLIMVCVVVLALVLSPILSDAPVRDFKMEILESLRDKPLTINQSLDIAGIISHQKAIPIPLLLAVISVESEGVFYAKSKKDCRGIFQLSKTVWEKYQGETVFKNHSNAHNPSLNTVVAIQYLSDLFNQYGSWDKVLRFYCSGNPGNRSPQVNRYVDRVLMKVKKYKHGG